MYEVLVKHILPLQFDVVVLTMYICNLGQYGNLGQYVKHELEWWEGRDVSGQELLLH